MARIITEQRRRARRKNAAMQPIMNALEVIDYLEGVRPDKFIHTTLKAKQWREIIAAFGNRRESL